MELRRMEGGRSSRWEGGREEPRLDFDAFRPFLLTSILLASPPSSNRLFSLTLFLLSLCTLFVEPGMMTMKGFHRYCKRVRESGEWGGEPEVSLESPPRFLSAFFIELTFFRSRRSSPCLDTIKSPSMSFNPTILKSSLTVLVRSSSPNSRSRSTIDTDPLVFLEQTQTPKPTRLSNPKLPRRSELSGSVTIGSFNFLFPLSLVEADARPASTFPSTGDCTDWESTTTPFARSSTLSRLSRRWCEFLSIRFDAGKRARAEPFLPPFVRSFVRSRPM